MISKRYIGYILSFFILSAQNSQAADQKFEVLHKNQTQTVLYDLYIDPQITEKNLPILICVGGLHLVDGIYSHSSTQECRTRAWLDFARQNKLAILGVGFKFEPNDWKDKTSYQYAQVWSGKALSDIINQLAKTTSINSDEQYLYGVSAGAQFVIRYAHLYSESVKAVTAHASGGYDYPGMHIPTHFLLTVGDLDNAPTKRRDNAVYYTKLLKDLGVDVTLEIIPDIGHIQTEEQNQMSREFIEKVLNATD